MLILLVISSLFLSLSASADPLAKSDYFAIYAENVPSHIVASRMEQMFDLLTAGQKTTAKGLLKQDLLDALQAQLQEAQARADTITQGFVAPTNVLVTDVNDTDLQ